MTTVSQHSHSTPRATRGRRFLQAATLALVALVAAAGWWRYRAAPGEDDSRAAAALSELVKASDGPRSIEGRLTGGFRYGAFTPRRTRGSAPLASVAPQLLIARAELTKIALTSDAAAHDAALGVALLATGESTPAIELLQEALAEQPDAARWQSDLAAAYLARAADTASPIDLARAGDAAGHAAAIERASLEAHFNLAIVLEKLSLDGPAHAAWREYLAADSESPWAGEARNRERALAARLAAAARLDPAADVDAAIRRGESAALVEVVGRYPQVAREGLEDVWIGRWADHVSAGRASEAAATLTQIKLLAEAVAQISGDPHARRLTRTIERAAAHPSSDSTRRLAQSLRAYRDGRQLYAQDDVAKAATRFAEAVDGLRRTDNPLFGWALLHQALMTYRASNLDRTEQEALEVSRFAERHGYTTLLARAQWLRAFIASLRARQEDALTLYTAAAAHFDRIGEGENSATLHIQLAEVLDALGDAPAAWRHRARALSQIQPYFSARRRQAVLMSAARSALAQDLPYLADRIQTAVIANAVAWDAASPLSHSYYYRARIQARLGDLDAARRSLALARGALDRLSAPALSRANEAEFRLSEADVLRMANPRQAIDAIDRAFDWFRTTGVEMRNDSLYLTRSRARLALDDVAGAERDLIDGITGFEQQLSRVRETDSRISAFDQGWGLFSDLMVLQAERRKDAVKALLFAERGRARELATALGLTLASDARAFAEQAPADTAIVFYSLLDDRLLIWTITPKGIGFVDRPDVRRLRRAAARYVRLLPDANAESAARRTAMDLYDALIRPIAGTLRASRAVVFVPDGVLHQIPFSTLVDRESGRYVVEQHAVVASPSIQTFLRQSARFAALAPHGERALIIGNPAIDRTANPDLRDLPGAEREASALSAMYPSATLLLKDDATRGRLLEELPRHDVFHFGGHAVANSEFPRLSRLLAASPSAASGAIYGYELRAAIGPSLRLAVLAACRTANGRLTRGEGALSLSRVFLAADVPAVVATLWDVDDAAAAVLFERLHRGWRDGLDAATALQSAQLHLIRGADASLRSPAHWGALIAVAGTTPAARAS
jgi:CHAT domain-containing protein